MFIDYTSLKGIEFTNLVNNTDHSFIKYEIGNFKVFCLSEQFGVFLEYFYRVHIANQVLFEILRVKCRFYYSERNYIPTPAYFSRLSKPFYFQ